MGPLREAYCRRDAKEAQGPSRSRRCTDPADVGGCLRGLVGVNLEREYGC